MFDAALIKIGYGNLWRRKSRTLLLVGTIGFGLAAMIFSQGLYDGMMNQMIQDQIRSAGGDLSVYKHGYEQSKLLSDYIKDEAALSEVLRTSRNVKAFVSRLACEGVVSSTRSVQAVTLLGIDAAAEAEFIGYRHPPVSGRFAVGGTGHAALIGEQLAATLKVGVDDKIVIQGQSLNKEIVGAAVRVGGILKTNNPDIDESGVLLDKPALQELFQLDGVTEFCLLLEHPGEVDAVKTQLIRRLAAAHPAEPLELFTWKELNPLFTVWQKTFDCFIYISYVVVFLVVSLGIFFILLMSIMERVREFGILMAVGTPFRAIVRLVLYESLFMGLLGYLTGGFLGWLSLIYSRRFGLDFSYFSSGLTGVGMASIMVPDIRPGYFLLGLAAVVFSSAAAVVIPLWKLKRLNAVEAIRFV